MYASHYSHEISDLRERAVAVMRPDASAAMSARTTARCLSGVVGLVARRWGTMAMHQACAALVRHDDAWRSSFGKLPADGTGAVSEAVEMIAVVARGILPIAGTDHMRAALSFWATETDPAIWTSVVGE
jgi:hypothetical protein